MINAIELQWSNQPIKLIKDGETGVS